MRAATDPPTSWVQLAVFIRYCGVSVINVVTGQTSLFLLYAVLGWGAATANITAVCLSAIPAYLLSRAWVWRQAGAHSVSTEVVPFWALAILGLVLSTVAVELAEAHFEAAIMVNLANLAAFGVVWVAKFFVLDRLMWAEPTR